MGVLHVTLPNKGVYVIQEADACANEIICLRLEKLPNLQLGRPFRDLHFIVPSSGGLTIFSAPWTRLFQWAPDRFYPVSAAITDTFKSDSSCYAKTLTHSPHSFLWIVTLSCHSLWCSTPNNQEGGTAGVFHSYAKGQIACGTSHDPCSTRCFQWHPPHTNISSSQSCWFKDRSKCCVKSPLWVSACSLSPPLSVSLFVSISFLICNISNHYYIEGWTSHKVV